MDQKLASVFVVIALLLAGCLTDQEEDPEPQQEPEQKSEQHVVEAPPVTANLSANVTNGTAPLEVSFRVEANNTDERNATWELDVGTDEKTNGTALPAVVNITFEEVGNFTAILNVTAGEEIAQANVTISVNASELTRPVAVVIEGSSLVGHPADLVLCTRNGIDGDIHEIAPAEAGWSYQIAPAETFSVYWWSEPNPLSVMGGFVAVGEDSGTVPEGASHVEVCLQAGNAMEDYMLTLWDAEVIDLS